MLRCPACAQGAPEDSRFCPHCGAPIEVASATPTRTSVPSEVPPRAAVSARHLTSDPSGGGRFLPGTVLAGRYRILGLLGRGGMGEVYRADDLKLGQVVALKFLPPSVAKDEARLHRFLNEVKIARQISHPGVCRVYDVGEVDGHHFISMEYVDGEDLASLLRRIGRLPRDKAVQIARQLSAGLAAAHDQGVLHRDLKPANVMIDGRGRAKIADFGLAALAEEIGVAEVGAGTPAYMAPEQLAGKGVTVRSDIYSLGLVLYELFTGQPAFKATTPAELARLQETSTPTSPGSIVEGLDPAVERAILRCLEKEPGRRPASALAVAAALPGGDPLAAALAAGETPSPEMVAEAGGVGGLSPPVALALLGALVVGMVLIIALSAETQLTGIVSPAKSPEVLAERAREILETLGHGGLAVDSAFGFSFDSGYTDYLTKHDQTPGRWARLQKPEPPLLYFWYRESPRYLVPRDFRFVDSWNPPLDVSGMATVALDADGNLRRYERVPPQRDDSKPPWPEPDWSAFFRQAALDMSGFKPVEPTWFPLFYVDRRAAWEGVLKGVPEFAVRIEAASYHGQPAAFYIIWPWTTPDRMQETPRSLLDRVSTAVFSIVIAAMLLCAALLARRNLRLGRGDRKGAFRLAAFLLAAQTIVWVLRAHHVPDFSEMILFFTSFAWNLFFSAALWIVYMALEPYLRRLWPHMIVSWVRLLDGRIRDPLLGRDALIGMLAGTAVLLVFKPRFVGGQWAGLMTPSPDGMAASWSEETFVLGGLRYSIAMLFGLAPVMALPTLYMFVLLLLRLLLRKQGLAIAAFAVLWTLLTIPYWSAGNPWLGAAVWAIWVTTFLSILMRVGFVAMGTAVVWINLFFIFPMSVRLSSWYAVHTIVALAALAAFAGWAFHVSLAGRPVFRDGLLQD